MLQKKLVINGTEYVRADLRPALPKTKSRKYTVLAFGQDHAGETVFLRLKGFKTVKFNPGDQIEISTNQPTNQPQTQTKVS